VLEGPLVARGDATLEAAVLAEREHLGAAGARDLRGVVRGAVVHDQHVHVRQLAPQLVEHGGEVLLLVPGRDEDERVVRGRHATTIALTRCDPESPR
jgi:hypothetical protein